MNNTGAIMSLFFIYIFCYLVVVFLTQKRLYKGKHEQNRIYQIFYQLRNGYFEWGIWFDSIMASSGVFIIYVFLQMTNAKADPINTFIAMFVGTFYFGFILYAMHYTYCNEEQLYCIQRDEVIEDISLKEKLQLNPTFKFRNIWHFVNNVDKFPIRAYFFFYFMLRKVYLALVLLFLDDKPKVQLCLSSFSHLVVMAALWRSSIFKDKIETVRVFISELTVFTALGFMYFLLDDKSEDESFRLYYSYIVLSLFLLGLFVHGIFFFYNEIMYPVYYYCIKKGKVKKIVDLREARRDGRQSISSNPIQM